MTLIPNTYNGLVSSIKALAEDDSVEFEAYVPTAIFLAEENLIKKIDNKNLEVTTTVTATDGNNILTKPDGMRFVNDVYFLTSAGSYVQPKMRTNDYIRDYWPVANTSTSTYPHGQPKYYGNESDTEWVLGPTPASAYNVVVNYVAQVTHLSASNQTNYFTSNAAEALYYGTMVGMSEFMKDYTILPLWQARYTDAVEGLNNEGRRNRRDDGLSPSNPRNNQNTLKGDN